MDVKSHLQYSAHFSQSVKLAVPANFVKSNSYAFPRFIKNKRLSRPFLRNRLLCSLDADSTEEANNLASGLPEKHNQFLSSDDNSESCSSQDVIKHKQTSNFSRRGLLGIGLAALGGSQLVSEAVTSAATQSPGKTNRILTLWDMADVQAIMPAEPALETRVYNSSVLGEPIAVKEKSLVWEKLLASRVVYLGENESTPDPSDKSLELEIVKQMRDKCFAQSRPVTVALSVFPPSFQQTLFSYQGKKLIDEEIFLQASSFLSRDLFDQYLPILQYCRDSGVRIYACGVPKEVLEIVRSGGIDALSPAQKKQYCPPVGERWLPRKKSSFGSVAGLGEPSALAGTLPKGQDLTATEKEAIAMIFEDYNMTKPIRQAMKDGSIVGMLIVLTGASHVKYGVRGTAVPAMVSTNGPIGKLLKYNQSVVLLNPDTQLDRHEGDVPEADFLFYYGNRACKRNCYDRSEVARVFASSGRRRNSLPEDIQMGLERGVVPPETLKMFIDLDAEGSVFSEATKNFEGLRERWLADPRFLQRLFIEEAISISTTLLAQYQKRGKQFWNEIDYVITDTTRGAVVDFFTVWLPAPTLSFRSSDFDSASGGLLDGLKSLIGTLPDNAFQRPPVGESWSVINRVGAVVVGGTKLFCVGFLSSVGTISFSNFIASLRKSDDSAAGSHATVIKRPPILKTAAVYGGFLATSANLRYQAIAGLVEHWVADYFLASQPLLGAVLSFVARTGNSYWGTGQWVDIARQFGLQSHADDDGDSSSANAPENGSVSKPIPQEGYPKIPNGIPVKPFEEHDVDSSLIIDEKLKDASINAEKLER